MRILNGLVDVNLLINTDAEVVVINGFEGSCSRIKGMNVRIYQYGELLSGIYVSLN